MLFKFEFMKTQTAFRIDEKLLELLREKAKAQKRSLNNYIEYILYQVVGNIPNDETVQAINDARKNINLTPINDLDEYLENL
ncbi:MAG: hypothetical protein GKR88_10555 [Flavobacteriaceae bacterium]|nr:MAG: hypothetical protein GKR88_10555 [Flavobacteriaceae bacterium]